MGCSLTSEVEAPAEADATVDLRDLVPVATLLVGFGVWLQLMAEALFRAPSTGVSVGLAVVFVVPLAILGAGFVSRSRLALLLLYPLSLVPGVVLGGAVDFVLVESWVAARVIASAAMFLALGSNWLEAREGAATHSMGAPTTDRAVLYRGAVYSRIFPLLLLWAVPTWAIFFDPAVVSTMVRTYGESATVAQNFAATMVFFAWCVGAYVFFIVPALNVEYERRQLELKLERGFDELTLRDIGKSAVKWLAGTVLGTVVLLILI